METSSGISKSTLDYSNSYSTACENSSQNINQITKMYVEKKLDFLLIAGTGHQKQASLYWTIRTGNPGQDS
jgi:hypothetical protein